MWNDLAVNVVKKKKKKKSTAPVVQISRACYFFNETKSADKMLKQHGQENHQPEGPERTKTKLWMMSSRNMRIIFSRRWCKWYHSPSPPPHECGDAHHMLHSIWKRIRCCLYRSGMMTRKTATRRQRKNTMVWTIMPAGERLELQGFWASSYDWRCRKKKSPSQQLNLKFQGQKVDLEHRDTQEVTENSQQHDSFSLRRTLSR